MKKPSSHLIRNTLVHAGFSLVETLMATGIISTAALGTLGLLAGSMSASQDGNMRTKALVIAQEVFHDLQLGALNQTPAATDERQTKVLRPDAGATIGRHVLYYDRAGIPLVNGQPAVGASEVIYEKGSTVPGVAWLVSIEGIENEDLISSGGDGQVIIMPDEAELAPLGTSTYPFTSVKSSPDPTAPPPSSVLTQVRISIESPPSAPVKSRKKFSYDFYWNR